ncbi:MAG: Calx-beta domain-containing protein [Pricia sp.]
MKHSKSLLVCFLLLAPFIYGQRTYRDTFSNVSYSNQDGNSNFSSDWIEGRDDNNPSGGAIRVLGNRLRFRDLDDRFIYRRAPLAGASSATLTFDYDATGRGDENLLVYIWNPGANTFNLIFDLNTSDSGSRSYNLTAAEIASNPRILFFRGDTDWNGGESIFIDNVQFSATFPPVLTIDDVSVNEDEGTAVFTVRHTVEDTGGPFTVNYTTQNGTAIAGSDFTANSGTLNFNGNANDTEQITINITDDVTVENLSESYSVLFTASSDSSVDISDNGTGTIIDNDGLIITDGAVTNTCNATFLDPGGLGAEYPNNQDRVHTICPDTSAKDISIAFAAFDLEANFDFLYVYNGTDTSGTLLGQYDNGNPPPASLRSFDTTGCLTFRFTSDGSVTADGWEIAISCVDQGPVLTINDVTVDEDAGTADFTVTHTRIGSGPYTVTYQTADGTALGGSDYASITSGTLSFDGSLNSTRTITVNITDDTDIETSSETYSINFLSATNPSVDISAVGTGTINDNDLNGNTPLELVREFNGHFDYTSTGGSLRTASNDTDACAITTSSQAALLTDIPVGATIEKAYLYWAHSSIVPDDNVTFDGQNVTANEAYTTFLGDRQFFGYVSDVTTIVENKANINTADFTFTDLTIDNDNIGPDYCNTATVLGGWGLMVFYEDVVNLPVSTINLYQGFDGISDDANSYTLDSFYAISGTGAKASFLSWEGDANIAGAGTGTVVENLSVTTPSFPNTVLSGDGGQTGNNPYNSTIYDNTVIGSPINISNTYGLDWDTFNLSPYLNPGDTEITANVAMGQDFVISNAVVLKVEANLISGNVFEDINYPGGAGRPLAGALGSKGVEGVTLELYDSTGTLSQTTTSNSEGNYDFGGMADGSYSLRVVNQTLRSVRDGGVACTACYAVQTFRTAYDGTTLNQFTDEIGGANPSTSDSGIGTLAGAQSVSVVIINNGGVANLDFGFNFNTIVNSNEDGQGSLEQFIVNANNLGETYDALTMDIEGNSIFNPSTGDDTSIFMIPTTTDPLGRSADPNFASGYFDIFISNGNPLSTITGANTKIDGRTQTAYSGNTNLGTMGSGGANVGTSASVLPDYQLPEIQVHRNGGDVFKIEGTAIEIRNLAIYANNNAGIEMISGNATLSENGIGVNADGNASGQNIDNGIEITGGEIIVERNYIAFNTTSGVRIDGGTSSILQDNHFTDNGRLNACDENIRFLSGSGVVIRRNLIERGASAGIDSDTGASNAIISENTVRNNGLNTSCNGIGVRGRGDNYIISNNIIHSNSKVGIVLAGGNTTGNLISRNSIYANGTFTDGLGIDLSANNGDGVTLNDLNDADNGANGNTNFPVVSLAHISGTNLTLEGWSRPGATIEIFISDISEGTAVDGDNRLGLSSDYGEGQTYLATVVEGSASDTRTDTSTYVDLDANTDATNKFRFVVPIPMALPQGTLITTTATISGSTSEFSPLSIVNIPTVITNRRITYRVKKD